MQSSHLLVFVLLACLLLAAECQFFFPFGMGASNQAPAGYGATYGNSYGVKDSEGYFAMCKGWTCQN